MDCKKLANEKPSKVIKIIKFFFEALQSELLLLNGFVVVEYIGHLYIID